jgi:predicted transcriptional regulator
MNETKEKRAGVMVSIKLDQDLAERLARVSHATGISKTRLITDGLRLRLDRIERVNQGA